MSKINVFTNTVIQTNGDTPYILKTIERTASLNEVFIESKTNDVINIDMQDIEFSGVSIKGGSEIGETTLTWVRTSKNTQPWTLVDNRILTCTEELKEQYADELQFLVSKGYNIDVPVSSFITVDLNYEWTPDVFPGPTGYGKEDGWLSFGSTSNYHDYTQASTAYLRFKGNGRKLQVYAAGSGRYTSGYVYNMDSETEVLMSLPNMSLPNRTSINNWANIEIDIPNDNQDHFIKFTYPARSSTYQYLDRAGFLINVNDVDMVIKDYKDKPEQPDIDRLEVYTLGRLISGEPYGDYEVDTENLGVITQTGTYVAICGFGPDSIDTYKEPKYWENVVIDAFDNIGFSYSNLQFDTTYVQVAQWWDTAGWLFIFFDITQISSLNGFLDISIKYKDIVSETKRFNISEQQPTLNLTLDLNNEWRRSTWTNPEPYNYDMYESASNWHVGNSVASAYLRFEPRTADANLIVPINSYAESSYDYTAIYAIDDEINIQEQTLNYQYDPSGAIDEFWKTTDYIIPGDNQTHFIKVIYSKDRSADADADRGFLLVPKGTPFINEYVE